MSVTREIVQRAIDKGFNNSMFNLELFVNSNGEIHVSDKMKMTTEVKVIQCYATRALTGSQWVRRWSS